MKILFVSSGNTKEGISPIIFNQGNSLKELNHDVQFFTIKGKNLFGYLKNIFRLKKILKNNSFDIIHAHYSFSAFVATLAGANPLVVSLMGTDVKEAGLFIYLLRFLTKRLWRITIVKSEDMKKTLGINSVLVVPNGVDINQFKTIAKTEALEFLKWDKSKKHLLFAASKFRPEKNFKLFENAMTLINDPDLCYHTLEEVDYSNMPYYYYASDVVILTSKHEGSPNVIKEALACNKSIVATNVGDIKEIIGNTRGCYVTKFEPEDLARKIKSAISLNSNNNGRQNVMFLTSEVVANRLIGIYSKLVN